MIIKKQYKKSKIDLKYDKISKKLKKAGMSKDLAGELSFHFMEIEYSFGSIIDNINNICDARSKKKISEELEHIWSEFEIHVVNSHIIPAKNILKKYLKY
jgi:hypothetical protein